MFTQNYLVSISFMVIVCLTGTRHGFLLLLIQETLNALDHLKIYAMIADCFMMSLNTKYMISIIITKTINMLSKSYTF